MDPNEALKQIRQYIADLQSQEDLDFLDVGEVMTMLELVQNLDEWLTKGGFLPSNWGGNKALVEEIKEYRAIKNKTPKELIAWAETKAGLW